MDSRRIQLKVNGQEKEADVCTRLTLADLLRNEFDLTGTHLGCEHGFCGACTVLLDGEAVRSCLTLAVQANGRAVTTVEGLSDGNRLSRLQAAFQHQNGLQCGFCTPGFLMTATAFLAHAVNPTEQEVREALSGNLCRCTGYQGIVQAVLEAAREPLQPEEPSPPACAGNIGAALDRSEDKRLLLGRGVYTADIRLPRLAQAAVLRSTHARARIVSLDTVAARRAPGVLAVLTFADISDIARPLPQVQPHPALNSRVPYPLVRDVARYVGEPLAIVVAENRYQAEDALDLIDVEYEPLPAAIDPERALRDAEARVHDDLPDNVAGRFGQEVGHVEQALKESHTIIRERLTIGRVSGQAMETRAITAAYDAGKLTVWLTSQSPHMTRRVMAEQLQLPLEDVHVIAPDIGGGFGPKNRYYPEYTLVPLLAMQLGRPVSWVEDRRESFTATYHAREQVHEVTLGLAEDGTIMALRDHYLYDQGAYTPIGVVVPHVTSVSIPGPYRVPAYEVDCTMVFTNKTPGAPYRGAGKPQAAFIIERMLDFGAQALNLDPVEIRRRNLIKPEEFPYHTKIIDMDETEVIYDSGNYQACLERALELIGYEDFPLEQAEAGRERRLTGIGVACYATKTGRGPFEGARVRVEPDGQVFVHSGVASQGQGHQTTLAQVCAEHLGVRFSDVTVRNGDTADIEKSIGTYAARVAVMAGNAVAKAAGAVREKALQAAADIFAVAPEMLELANGVVRVSPAPGQHMTLGQIAQYLIDRDSQTASSGEPSNGLDETRYYQNNEPPYANGTYAVVIELDRQTGIVKILRHALVHDCGIMINPRIVEGQIYGGVAQGISETLLEELCYDEAGQPLADSYKSYSLPNAALIPTLMLDHLETPSPFNPLGVKGAGEGGTVPVSAAIISAIENAVGGAVRLRRRPVHPVALQELLRASENF
jgi:carbon-monoxide dehydrogenase large subunit